MSNCKSNQCFRKWECLAYLAPTTEGQKPFDYLALVEDSADCRYFIKNGLYWHKQHRIIQVGDQWKIATGRWRSSALRTLDDSIDHIDDSIYLND